MKKSFPITTAALTALSVLLASGSVLAHGGESDVTLHTGYDYAECYFDLHPELTKSQFRQFAAEAGQFLYFRPVASAKTLGAWNFDLSFSANRVSLDDTKGAWNNTMSHPGDDHYLGDTQLIPQLTLRMGVSDSVDVEAYGTKSPGSNFGFVGIATKVQLVEQGDGLPIALAVRPSLSALIGPSETNVANFGFDVLASREFHGLSPFVGATVSTSVALDRSDEADVGHQGAVRPIALAGLDYRWKFLSAGVQAEVSSLTVYSLRLGARF